MIILDTNVLSEPMRAEPNSHVVSWLDAQAVETLFLTTIGLAEVRFGIAALPAGRRRRILTDRFENELVPVFGDRILSFDEPATVAYAQTRAEARARGQALGDFDALIAGIAVSRRCAVASRDTAPFLSVGIEVINPFAGRGQR